VTTKARGRRIAVPTWLRLVREPVLTLEAHDTTRISGPEDVQRLLRPYADREEIEVFWVLTLNSQSCVRGISEVTRGLLNASLVHPREVFRVAVIDGAAGIILAHNHPSGDPTPSAEDRAVTKQLVAAGRLLDIPVYDHIVLGADRFVSFATAGLL
jgi:DNA repair protein RadC